MMWSDVRTVVMVVMGVMEKTEKMAVMGVMDAEENMDVRVKKDAMATRVLQAHKGLREQQAHKA
jgi:hypothetical protein